MRTATDTTSRLTVKAGVNVEADLNDVAVVELNAENVKKEEENSGKISMISLSGGLESGMCARVTLSSVDSQANQKSSTCKDVRLHVAKSRINKYNYL